MTFQTHNQNKKRTRKAKEKPFDVRSKRCIISTWCNAKRSNEFERMRWRRQCRPRVRYSKCKLQTPLQTNRMRPRMMTKPSDKMGRWIKVKMRRQGEKGECQSDERPDKERKVHLLNWKHLDRKPCLADKASAKQIVRKVPSSGKRPGKPCEIRTDERSAGVNRIEKAWWDVLEIKIQKVFQKRAKTKTFGRHLIVREWQKKKEKMVMAQFQTRPNHLGF